MVQTDVERYELLTTTGRPTQYDSLPNNVDQNTIKAEEELNNGEKTDTDTHDAVRLKILAFLAMLTIVIMVCVSIVCVQVLNGIVPDFELNAWRFGPQAAIASLILMYMKSLPYVPRSSMAMLFCIMLTYFGYNFSYYAAAKYLPVGMLGGGHSTVAMVTNAALSICVKSERSVLLYISSAVAICGIVLMVQPPWMFPDTSSDFVTNWTSPCVQHSNATLSINDVTTAWYGYVYVTLSGMSMAFGINMIRRILQDDVKPIVITFWTGVLGFSVSIVCSAVVEEMRLTSGLMCSGLLLLHVIGTLSPAIGAPYVLQHMSSTVYAMLNCSRLVLLLLLQYTVLSSVIPGKRNWIEVVGAALCLAGTFLGPLIDLLRQIYNKPNSIV